MKYIFLILLVCCSLLVSAAKINLDINGSYSRDGRNITLIDVGKNSVLFCVNNEEVIVSKEKPKTVKDVNIELTNIYINKIRADIKVYCKSCKCDYSCSNIDCFAYGSEVQGEIKNNELKLEDVTQETEIIESKNNMNNSIIISLTILFLLLTILYFLVKRR